MFVRVKNSHGYKYLQIVESKREGAKVKQRVLATLGQLDALSATGKIDDLTLALSKFASHLKIIDAHRQGTIQAHRTVAIGPALVFERLWHELHIDEAIKRELSTSRCHFSLEKAIFLTVLHRLFEPENDRSAERWKEDFQIKGAEDIELHQLYRAMGWLGEQSIQLGHDARSLRCRKDLIEEELFRANPPFSANWRWCSSTPQVCTSRVKGERVSNDLLDVRLKIGEEGFKFASSFRIHTGKWIRSSRG